MVIVMFQVEMRKDVDLVDYDACSQRMDELVRQIPGFISIKGYVAEDGEKISIVRFESKEALDMWRHHPEHVEAQQKGRNHFYDSYSVQVCETVREYEYRHQLPL